MYDKFQTSFLKVCEKQFVGETKDAFLLKWHIYKDNGRCFEKNGNCIQQHLVFVANVITNSWGMFLQAWLTKLMVFDLKVIDST